MDNHIEIVTPVQPNVYDEIAAKELASFNAYKRVYSVQYPPPEKQKPESDNQIMQVGITAIMIASTFASAVHTIPKFLEGVDAPPAIGWLVGGSTFVMVELAIIIFSYAITRQRQMYDKSIKADKIAWQKYAALYLSFIVAVIVNVYATVENTVPFSIPTGLQIAITILIGLCPPVTAYISGDILAALWVEKKRAEYRIQLEFKPVQAEWEEKCRKSWKATISKEGSVYAPIQLNSVNSQMNGANGKPYANGNSKQLALEYLEKYPDDISLKLDDLKDKIEEWSGYEVGRTSVHNARTEFKQRQVERT